MKSGIYRCMSMQDYDEMFGRWSSPAMREVVSDLFLRAGLNGQISSQGLIFVVPEEDPISRENRLQREAPPIGGDDLDRPLEIPELAKWLQGRGERVSRATLYGWARQGLLPVSRVGRMTSTARAYYAVRTPEIAAHAPYRTGRGDKR